MLRDPVQRLRPYLPHQRQKILKTPAQVRRPILADISEERLERVPSVKSILRGEIITRVQILPQSLRQRDVSRPLQQSRAQFQFQALPDLSRRLISQLRRLHIRRRQTILRDPFQILARLIQLRLCLLELIRKSLIRRVPVLLRILRLRKIFRKIRESGAGVCGGHTSLDCYPDLLPSPYSPPADSWHAGGQRFKSAMLHVSGPAVTGLGAGAHRFQVANRGSSG